MSNEVRIQSKRDAVFILPPLKIKGRHYEARRIEPKTVSLIEAEVWDAVKDRPDVAPHIGDGDQQFRVLADAGTTVASAVPETLTNVSDDAATMLIADCRDVPRMIRWLSGEGRDGVRQMLLKRIELVESKTKRGEAKSPEQESAADAA